MEAGAGIHGGQRRRRFGPAHAVLVLCLAVMLGIGIGAGVNALAHHGSRPAVTAGQTAATVQSATTGLYGQATWRVGVRPAPAITTLRDQSGHLFALSSLHGRTVAMTFFDSHCTQACPLEGRALASAERAMPAAQRPVLVVVSVNPLDTPVSTRTAIRKWGLAGLAPWYWLRGTHAQLASVWKAYHIFVSPPINGDIEHTEALYLIDRRGDERSGYLYPFAPRFVTLDMRTLAKERER
jgi:cytochrome oxidase Cu insertion factor (SCO1/SenC/PrrC family)